MDVRDMVKGSIVPPSKLKWMIDVKCIDALRGAHIETQCVEKKFSKKNTS